MGLYKRAGSPYWWYKFKVKGVTYRGSTEKRNKAEAQQVELDERRKVTAPPEAARNEVTLGEAADAWLEDEGKALADARNNESRVRKLFGEAAGPRGQDTGKRYGLPRTMALHRLTNEEITKLVRARKREGNSPKTINREIALLQSIVRYARVKLRAKVPVDLELKEFKAREGKGRLRFFTLEEEARLLADLDPTQRYSPEEWKALPEVSRRQQQDQYDLVVFLLDTGGRYGEGAGVPWDVVDFERNTVNLYRDKVGDEGVLELTQRLRAVLIRRWNARDPKCPWIFPGFGSNAGPRGYAVKGIRNAVERCGLNAEHIVARFGRATPAHTLRHTFASRLVQAGFSLQKVALLLGHADVKTTQIYAHLVPGDAAKEAASVLDRLHAPRPAAEVIPMRVAAELSGANDRGGSALPAGAQKEAQTAGAQEGFTVIRAA